MNQYIPLIKTYAEKYAIDFPLLAAVIEQESQFNCWAIRYEPAFYTRYVAPLLASKHILDITEAEARAMSWGVMQVMGQVAREFGYGGPLPKLCDWETGLDIGCKVLKNKLASAQKVEDGLERWNGGASKTYATEVLARVVKYQSL